MRGCRKYYINIMTQFNFESGSVSPELYLFSNLGVSPDCPHNEARHLQSGVRSKLLAVFLFFFNFHSNRKSVKSSFWKTKSVLFCSLMFVCRIGIISCICFWFWNANSDGLPTIICLTFSSVCAPSSEDQVRFMGSFWIERSELNWKNIKINP